MTTGHPVFLPCGSVVRVCKRVPPGRTSQMCGRRGITRLDKCAPFLWQNFSTAKGMPRGKLLPKPRANELVNISF